MKIQCFSDLHLEFYNNKEPEFPIIDPNVDVIVLAGDVGYPDESTWKRLKLLFDLAPNADIIFVAGNHEYYCQKSMEDVENWWRKKDKENDCFHFLQKDRITIKNVDFLGITLWTHLKDDSAMDLNDFYKIPWMNSIKAWNKIHYDHLNWLEKEIIKPSKNPIVVVTHHAPHILSINPKYLMCPRSRSINDKFYTDDIDPDFFYIINLWIHGHTHSPIEYKIENTRVVCHPWGYPNEGERNLKLEANVFDIKN